ncbi:hypothetical protein H5410_049338 [Solanum commersonii]|uniref:Uncharacterized protein n=1 Tax=Solanum commersonii TaxID=4109 RepID=A0A9J5WTU3_SOLCO|nr:hypothetical protein H5410_049338 [Solanum commersonii]
MDILALASMKNVAKCDTWCELHNPVNHQVLKRKLHSKTLGRGHHTTRRRVEQKLVPVQPERAAGLNVSPRQRTSQQVVVETQLSLVVAATSCRASGLQTPIAPTKNGTPTANPASSTADWAQVPWKGALKKVRAPLCSDPIAPRGTVYKSDCLGILPKSGGEFRPRLNTGERPIANKYRKGKMKRTLKRESKSA